jgi:hypothetical protein
MSQFRRLVLERVLGLNDLLLGTLSQMENALRCLQGGRPQLVVCILVRLHLTAFDNFLGQGGADYACANFRERRIPAG